MKLTAFYQPYELSSDPVALRDYAQAAEDAGYDRIAIGEHVLGVDPDRPGGWDGAYTYEHEWADPFPTFGYLAAVTTRIELMSCILILPQRQTALVAKQAAQLDVLSGGRFVLGVGSGWNPVEYEALGEDFHNRGRRMEEQVELLRALWSDPIVSFEGRWHNIVKAGINPRPAGGSIPIWFGGGADRVLDRVGRIGDGWLPLVRVPEAPDAGIGASGGPGGTRLPVETSIERIREAARKIGRDPEEIGVQCSIVTTGAEAILTAMPEQVALAKRLEAAGATHVGVRTCDAGLVSMQQHIDAIRLFAEEYRKA